jgi:hypothetical protein
VRDVGRRIRRAYSRRRRRIDAFGQPPSGGLEPNQTAREASNLVDEGLAAGLRRIQIRKFRRPAIVRARGTAELETQSETTD